MQMNYKKKLIYAQIFHFFVQTAIFLCKIFGNTKYFYYLCNRITCVTPCIMAFVRVCESENTNIKYTK